MTAADTVLAVHQATVDQACRRCGAVVARGRRVALVAGIGVVHLRCILVAQEVTVTSPDQPATTSAGKGPDPPGADQDGDIELAEKRGWDR